MLIPKLQLDPMDDAGLLQQAIARTAAASNGQLNDWSLGSPARALIEGQVFSIAELLYWLNMLPEALALEVFRLAGVERNAGTKATGTLVFQLQYPINSNFILDGGYTVAYADSYFVTTQQLVIPAGATSARVICQAATIGSAYNASAYAVVNTAPGLAYLQTIYNDQPMTGGTDLEDLSATVARSQDIIRSHNVLVSVADYETAATDLLGGGKASCIPLLSSDGITFKPGQVHLYLSDATGSACSTGTCQTIQQQLQQRSFVASSVWVSPIDFLPLTVSIVASCQQLSQSLADAVYQSIKNYLSPLVYDLGSTLVLNELSYVTRNTVGITSVASTTVNGQALNLPMTSLHHTPQLTQCQVSLIQADGVAQTYYYDTAVSAISAN